MSMEKITKSCVGKNQPRCCWSSAQNEAPVSLWEHDTGQDDVSEKVSIQEKQHLKVNGSKIRSQLRRLCCQFWHSSLKQFHFNEKDLTKMVIKADKISGHCKLSMECLEYLRRLQNYIHVFKKNHLPLERLRKQCIDFSP